MEKLHSVTLDRDLCKGCTNCIKRCPTEAIRVRKGKAEILLGRCIDCGECIRVCPHHAKRAVYDTLSILKNYKYTIALPAPSLFGQFPDLEHVDVLLRALITVGFDEVYEVAKAAEIVSDATRKYMAEEEGLKKPIISSACPTITRLIQIRFPNLIDHILPLITPAELAAKNAKKEAAARTGLKEEEIGAIFISPCPAKVTTINNPIGIEKSHLDGAIAIKELYPVLLAVMKKEDAKKIKTEAGIIGFGWGSSGGEATATEDDSYLAADGIENCIRVLEDLEDEKFGVDFVELNACPGGCVGGVLAVENPFIAMVKIKFLREGLPVMQNILQSGQEKKSLLWNRTVEYQPVMELDHDIATAMEKLSEIEAITAELKGLDCGSCGSPSCRAFAEDIVKGESQKEDCIFVLRESMHDIAQKLAQLSSLEEGAE
ncbi:MAG: [Fe-Fe] hydrogenase large subunit C-terminal domain-containing protein [Christensenellaceae bacterium]|jgi:iron only hydrogenase large subunit-like protein